MAARRSEKIFEPDDAGAGDAAVNGSPPPTAPEKRVLSVSPLSDSAGDEPDRSGLRNAVNGQKVFISPRVVDQQAFDELAASLRTLIDEAGGASGTLRKLISQSKDSDKWTGKASQHLQERLRLSARMLKAFQSQIARVEQSIEQMERQEQAAEAAKASMDESLEAFEEHLSEVLEKFERRLGEMADCAIDRFEQHLAERREVLAEIESRVDEAKKRSHATATFAEEIETRVARLAHRAARNAASIEARSAEARTAVSRDAAMLRDKADAALARFETNTAEMRDLLRRCEEASRRLSTEVEQTDEHIEEASVRCRGIRCALEAKLDQCREAEQAFEQRFGELSELIASLEVDARSYESLAGLLERLAPWEKLLLRGDGEHEGLPESVAVLVDELRTGIGRDMERLAASMTDIVRRIEKSGLVERRVTEAAELKPHADGTSAAIESSVGQTIGEIKTKSRGAETR